MSTERAAAVLCGGRSTRMGSDKALVEIAGESMLARVVRVAGAWSGDVMLVANDPARYCSFGIPIVGDLFPECGPLAGIHSALLHAAGRDVLILACDLPYLTTDVVGLLSRAHVRGATVPRLPDGLQPLCGIYDRACAGVAERLLREGRRAVHEFLVAIGAREVPITDAAHLRALRNVNAVEDLAGEE